MDMPMNDLADWGNPGLWPSIVWCSWMGLDQGVRMCLQHGNVDANTLQLALMVSPTMQVTRTLVAGAFQELKLDLNLHYAVSAKVNGDIELAWAMTELLLRSGADANSRAGTPWTPLARAAFWGLVDHVHLLLQHGADVDAVDEDGQSALHWSVMPLLFTAEDGLAYLLHAHATVEFAQCMYAIADCARLLLRAGADPWLPNCGGVTPMGAMESVLVDTRAGTSVRRAVQVVHREFCCASEECRLAFVMGLGQATGSVGRLARHWSFDVNLVGEVFACLTGRRYAVSYRHEGTVEVAGSGRALKRVKLG